MALKRVTKGPLGKSGIPNGPQCPNCGALTIRSLIPCPDPTKEIAPGVYSMCAALHLGWRCECCGTSYEEVADK